MYRSLFLVACFVLLTAPLSMAQEVTLQSQAFLSGETYERDDRGSETPDRLNSPIGRAALEAFHARKASGTMPVLAFKRVDPEVGERMDFQLRENGTLSFETQTFELVGKGDRYYIWVDPAELGNVDAATVDQLKVGIGEATPAGSYNPNAGIIDNNEAVFGDPPNVDGDTRVDVLVFDLPSGIAGYFDPVDIAPNNDGSGFLGNGRDMIYIDSRLNTTLTLAVIAHEYQHLIHANYDPNERTFINEGLSEWAEIMNGYNGRRPNYLSLGSALSGPLFDWQGVNIDYQRAVLFTTYIAERLGVEATGSITRERLTGASGYTNVFNESGSGLTLSQVTANFHLANLLNDASISPDYAHLDEYSTVRAIPQLSVDARTEESIGSNNYALSPGSVLYAEVLNVTNPRFAVGSISGNSSSSEANRVSAYVVLEALDGATRVEEVAYEGNQQFEGEFARATLVIAHVQPANPFVLNVRYSGSWDSQGGIEISTIAYDDGSIAISQNAEGDPTVDAYSLGADARHANRFVVPAGGTLTAVSIAPQFENQFSDSPLPDSAPQDLRLHVWAATADGFPSVAPEDELFTLDIEDVTANPLPRNTAEVDFAFTNINLQAYVEQLSNLPDTVYIGLSNIGTDANYLAMGVSAYDNSTEDSPSALYLAPNFCAPAGSDDCWASFAGVTASGEPIFEDRVVPIRAEFTVGLQGTSNEDVFELPEQVTLEQNYPNPFNPTSTIAFTLPASSDVRLTVYDLLGRPIATLTDGTLAAGRHQVAVDATEWASGVYLYVLQTPSARVTQTMHLLK
ncbi:MAG: T9SS type A sorting domain-containing protein [Bacteroidota bacterium]